MFPLFVIILLCTSYNTPCDAYPSGGETESESSGEESVDVMSDESVDSVNAILNLDDNAEESNNDGDNGYDIVHKVVVDQPIDDDDDDEDDDDDDDDEDDDDDDDDEEDEEDLTPYKDYDKWRGWRKHPLFVVILGG